MFPIAREPLPKADPLLLTQALTWIVNGWARTDRELESDRAEQTKRNIIEWHSPDGPYWLLPILESLANGTVPKSSAMGAVQTWLKKRGLTIEAGLALARAEIMVRDNAVEREQVFSRLLFAGCSRGLYNLDGLRYRENPTKAHVDYEPIPTEYFKRNPHFSCGKGYYGHGELTSSPQSEEEILDAVFSRSVEADRSPVFLGVKISRDDAEQLRLQFDNELRSLEREKILARVNACEITPQQGEAECAQLGLSPLNPPPDSNNTDPLELDEWSLVMVIAWIASRNLDVVRRYMDAYRAQLSFWTTHRTPDPNNIGRSRRTMALQPARPPYPTYFDLQFLDLEGDGLQMAPDGARADLWRKLKSEQLTADAVDVATGKRVAIPGREFKDLEISSDSRGGDKLVSTATAARILEAVYLKPRLRRADVMALWEPLVTAAQCGAGPTTSNASPPEKEQPKFPERLRPSFRKIAAAIQAVEKETGKPFPILNPKERNKRLSERMSAQGLKESEIPKPRTFRAYFNEGPGKAVKSG